MEKMTISIVPAKEDFLLYANADRCRELGIPGYVRGDFGSNGKEFWTTWFEQCLDLKTKAFQNDLDETINALRNNGMLKDLCAMKKYFRNHPENKLCEPKHRGDSYGCKIETAGFIYYVRCILAPNDYNFYCFCHHKNILNEAFSKITNEAFSKITKEKKGSV